MYLSVIIPTYNRNEMLKNCLELMDPERQTLDGSLYEVIISDDSKEHNAAKIAMDYPWAKFIKGPQKGPASNRNFGASQAKGDWLVFIDDDCLPDKEILKTYYNEIIRGETRAIEGYIDAERPQNKFNEESPLNLHGDCFWSCNIALEKKLFQSLNGFDEGFPYAAMEDVDLYYRIKEVSNHKFLAEAKVIHPWRTVRPFQNFKKRLLSHKYILEKNNVKRDFKYRYKRLKLFVGQCLSDTALLFRFSFRGFLVYVDRLCFHFVMLFI